MSVRTHLYSVNTISKYENKTYDALNTHVYVILLYTVNEYWSLFHAHGLNLKSEARKSFTEEGYITCNCASFPLGN